MIGEVPVLWQPLVGSFSLRLSSFSSPQSAVRQVPYMVTVGPDEGQHKAVGHSQAYTESVWLSSGTEVKLEE